LGYLAGFLYLNIFVKKKNRLISIVLLIVSLSLIVALFAAMPKGTVQPVDATLGKLEIANKNMDRVLSGKKIIFYDIIERQGADNTSGLWRLYQWHRILTLFVQSSADKILFGNGVGTTDLVFKLKAHNDYLRILFETGLIGLILNLSVWFILYRRMAIQYRWLVIMIAVFCFTENNYDHFPAMSLLVFYMIGAGGQSSVEKTEAGTSVISAEKDEAAS
jgi:O-antigen ligase